MPGRRAGRHGAHPLLLLVERACAPGVPVPRRDLGPAGSGRPLQPGARRGVSAEHPGLPADPRDLLRGHPAPAARAHAVRERRSAVPDPLLGPGAPRLHLGDRERGVPLHGRARHGGRSQPGRRRGQPGAERRLRFGEPRGGGGRARSRAYAPARGVAALHRSLLRRRAETDPGRRGAGHAAGDAVPRRVPRRGLVRGRAPGPVSPEPGPRHERLAAHVRPAPARRGRSGARPPDDGHRRGRDVLREHGLCDGLPPYPRLAGPLALLPGLSLDVARRAGACRPVCPLGRGDQGRAQAAGPHSPRQGVSPCS